MMTDEETSEESKSDADSHDDSGGEGPSNKRPRNSIETESETNENDFDD